MSASQEWVIQLQNASLSASLNHSTSGANLNPDSLRNRQQKSGFRVFAGECCRSHICKRIRAPGLGRGRHWCIRNRSLSQLHGEVWGYDDLQSYQNQGLWVLTLVSGHAFQKMVFPGQALGFEPSQTNVPGGWANRLFLSLSGSGQDTWNPVQWWFSKCTPPN